VISPVPSRIEPVFSPRIWGARSLAPLFPEKVDLAEPLGEAWLTAFDSRIANGPYAGKTLGESWRAMPISWRGTRVNAYPEFPVLVKFLFPQDNLSIQVHPDDAYAVAHEKEAGGRGKTEMWHMVSTQSGAEILLGLKPGVTKEQFLEGIANHQLENLLEHLPVHPGDTYFVAAGTQHAMGPGMVVCEVQEYSDLTYRVYDFGRVDASGKPRELHIEKALEVTNFSGTRGGKVSPLTLHSPDAKKYLLSACPYFSTERWECHKATPIESDPQEFQLIVILHGAGTFNDADFSLPYRAGEAWFLPATLPMVLLHPSGPTSLLRVTIPDLVALHRKLSKLGFEEKVLSKVLVT
jgi:mannose-6-phosphate isomerase